MLAALVVEAVDVQIFVGMAGKIFQLFWGQVVAITITPTIQTNVTSPGLL